MKNRKTAVRLAMLVAAAFGLALAAYAQQHAHTDARHQGHADAKHRGQHSDCPSTQSDKSKASGKASGGHGHLAAVNERGEKAMGFSQTKTTHNFLLTRDGGAIRVEVKDPKDAASRDAVRKHLAYIAQAFRVGDFDTPFAVHDKVPPGVPVMCRLKADIKYAYEETGGGARVRISTSNAEALAAVHEFLRFQIEDHQTGDTPEINQ